MEDDQTIGRVLKDTLGQHGHDVRWQTSGHDALSDASANMFDLALVDLGLPDLDGTEVCRRLREVQPGCVLVILTARTEEMDVIVGLEAGADDYLTKPVRLAELHARIRAHLRRGSTGDGPHQVVDIGQLRIAPDARRVTVAGREISLRAKEFDLLFRLASAAGVVVRRETLMADVWDAHWFGSTKTLDVHVAAIRRKLAEGGARVPEIVTIRGVGYRMEAE